MTRPGPRVTASPGIFIDGAPIDPAATYTIASSSFLITTAGSRRTTSARSSRAPTTATPDSSTRTPSSTGSRPTARCPADRPARRRRPQRPHGDQLRQEDDVPRRGSRPRLGRGGQEHLVSGVAQRPHRDDGSRQLGARRPASRRATGSPSVSFKLIGKILPDDSPRTVYIKIVAPDSGTTAWIPVTRQGLTLHRARTTQHPLRRRGAGGAWLWA